MSENTKPLAADVNPLASSDDGTLIKDFPLATDVNDDDDLIIETNLPQTEHVKAETFKDYVLKDSVLEAYPIGAVYISTVDTSPAVLFGGVWSQIQNRFLIAAGSSYTAGTSGGNSTVTLSESNLPSHTHSLPEHTHSLPSHTHSLPSHTHSLPSHTHSIPSHYHSIPSHTHSIPSLSGTAASAGAHTHQVGTINNSTGGGSQKRLASLSGAEDYDTTTSNGAHTHSVTTNSSTTGSYSGNTGSTSATSGSTSGTSGSTSGTSGSTSGTSGSASGTSGSTGSGTSFSIVPPYLAVYMWRRTA